MLAPQELYAGNFFGKKVIQRYPNGVDVSTGATVAVSGHFHVGDISLLFDFAVNASGAPTSVVPGGFTSIIDTAGATWRQIISYKKLVAGDPGSTLTGMNGTSANNKALYTFTPSWDVQTITPSTFNAEANVGDVAAQTINVLTAPTNALILVLACGSCEVGTVVFATQSPPFHKTAQPADQDMLIGLKQYSIGSPRENHTVDIADLGATNVLQSGYLAFT